MSKESMFHHVRKGNVPDYDDPDQEVWCPNIRAWLTRREHGARFADEAYAERLREEMNRALADDHGIWADTDD